MTLTQEKITHGFVVRPDKSLAGDLGRPVDRIRVPKVLDTPSAAATTRGLPPLSFAAALETCPR